MVRVASEFLALADFPCLSFRHWTPISPRRVGHPCPGALQLHGLPAEGRLDFPLPAVERPRPVLPSRSLPGPVRCPVPVAVQHRALPAARHRHRCQHPQAGQGRVPAPDGRLAGLLRCRRGWSCFPSSPFPTPSTSLMAALRLSLPALPMAFMAVASGFWLPGMLQGAMTTALVARCGW